MWTGNAQWMLSEAMSLTEDDITDRIAEALNHMSDPDLTIADQAALEYAGLNMALDYVQNKTSLNHVSKLLAIGYRKNFLLRLVTSTMKPTGVCSVHPWPLSRTTSR